jgi:4-amino-4-deoxy-L-arabinose transferase-like glycosyltransferase
MTAPADPTRLLPAGRKICFVGLPLLLIMALSLRIYGIKTIGLGGSDTILYFSLAEQWLQGNFVFRIGESTSVLRPVLLGFNALALQVFGHFDHAIKLANVLLDVVNLLLLALLAWLVSRRYTVVLACAASYAILPLAIWASRQELPHTLSTFFVLVSCVFCVGAGAGRFGALQLFLSGLCLGAAAMTHEELILLAVPLSLYLLLADRMHPHGGSLVLGFKRVALFSVVPASVAVLLYSWQAPLVRPLLQSALQPSAALADNYLERFYRFLWDAIAGSHSVSMTICVVLGLVFLGWCLRPNDRNVHHAADFRAGCFLLIPIIFVAVYALFLKTLFARAFLPLLPLLLVAVFYAVARVCEGRPSLLAGSLPVLVFVLLSASSLASYSAFNVGNRRFSDTWAQPQWPLMDDLSSGIGEFMIDARYAPGYATHWGAVYRALQHEVDVDHRLLVLPSTVMYSPGRRALQTEVYFGDNVAFRLDHANLKLEEVVASNKVKWVLFSRGQLREQPTQFARYLYRGQWAPSVPLDLARSYGMPRYTELGEFQNLLRFLEEAGAVEVHPFARDSYEYRVARLWKLP